MIGGHIFTFCGVLIGLCTKKFHLFIFIFGVAMDKRKILLKRKKKKIEFSSKRFSCFSILIPRSMIFTLNKLFSLKKMQLLVKSPFNYKELYRNDTISSILIPKSRKFT